MMLSEIHIEGFRNFKNSKIKLNEKTLFIGPNDIGKTNLLYAVRLLLDRSFSENDLEPDEGDFYVHENTDKIKITLTFTEANEDCIRSKFKENVSSDGTLILQYYANKNRTAGEKPYHLFVGPKLDNLTEIESRNYLRSLSLSYIDSNRDLLTFIKREKRNLLLKAKSLRTAEQQTTDEKTLTSIQESLNTVNGSVSKLSYVAKATEGLNAELSSLSTNNSDISVQFDAGASDPSTYVDNLKLTSKVKDKTVTLGGDGRSNQIYMALWAAQRAEEADAPPMEIIINCIEEPEAHLHPHQQRKLSDYLIKKLDGQLLLTSHSPQIACEFEHNSIVSLYDDSYCTKAANDGCSKIVENALVAFGHRLNIVPAEGFFSSCVYLVEGVSEVLFYKALATALEIDLDRLNISIVSVDGLSFMQFMKVYNSLKIPTVIRTDNDIIKKRNSKFRAAGIQRLISIYQNFYEKSDLDFNQHLEKIKPSISDLASNSIPNEIEKEIGPLLNKLETYNYFLSKKSLEADLIESPILDELKKHFDCENKEDLLSAMQERKGENMFNFLAQNFSALIKLKEHSVAKPLFSCQKLVKRA